LTALKPPCSSKTLDGFTGDWLLRHGVQRGIEIMAEAARRIPTEWQGQQLHFGNPSA
jgi:hypothetical protein